ncbi:hypothetical protein AX15_000847 [Amanita polypyramis BW_CC]|nr:hypothetical protein AX15_000847 [Amanita polypyramis BW_CC]
MTSTMPSSNKGSIYDLPPCLTEVTEDGGPILSGHEATLANIIFGNKNGCSLVKVPNFVRQPRRSVGIFGTFSGRFIDGVPQPEPEEQTFIPLTPAPRRKGKDQRQDFDGYVTRHGALGP